MPSRAKYQSFRNTNKHRIGQAFEAISNEESLKCLILTNNKLFLSLSLLVDAEYYGNYLYLKIICLNVHLCLLHQKI